MKLSDYKTWLQGFLDAKTGLALTAADAKKILDKLASVEPDVKEIKDFKDLTKQPPFCPGVIPPNPYWPYPRDGSCPSPTFPTYPDVFGPRLGVEGYATTNAPVSKVTISTCLDTDSKE